jgi:hypothetical protein
MLPGLMLSVLDWESVAGVAAMGAMTCFIAAILGGWRLALGLALPLAIASGLAVALSGNPWLAALLMAVAAGAKGVAAGRGLQGAYIMAPISVGFILAQPPRPDVAMPPALFVGLVVLAAGLYATLVVIVLLRLLPPLPPPALKPIAPALARIYGIVLGLMVGIAAWFVVRFDLGHGGAWLMLTIIVVLQPFVQDGIERVLGRAAGTTLGFAIAFAIAKVTDAPAVIYTFGMAAMVVAVIFLMSKRPYWQYAALLTTAIVLLEGAATSVVDTDLTRLAATLVGSAAVLLVTAVALPIAKKSATSRGVTHY